MQDNMFFSHHAIIDSTKSNYMGTLEFKEIIIFFTQGPD